MLGYVRTPHNPTFPSTVYACGLLLQEAQHLEISYIDTIAPGAQWEARSAPEGGPTRRSAVNSRMMIPVHRGKGAKDQCVPLPESTLQSLCRHWVTRCHPRFILRALGRGPNWACPRPALHPRRAWQASS
jgi:hypothetical protein